MKTILLGEATARSMEGLDLPAFSSRSGERLSELIGCNVRQAFITKNIIDHWPGPAYKGSLFPLAMARGLAQMILTDLDNRAEDDEIIRLVAAGRRVSKALWIPSTTPYLEWFDLGEVSKRLHTKHLWVAILPHPSGINRWWNKPSNVEAAKQFLLKEIDEVSIQN